MVMIFAGRELVENFHWIIYFFGLFLTYTQVKIFLDGDNAFDPEHNKMVFLATKHIRIKKKYVAGKFNTVENANHVGTIFLVVLIVVVAADVIFAVDSISGIFGVTSDRFIVDT